MRYLRTVLAASTALSAPAYAADKPLLGPAPAWVRPVAAPASAKPDEAPVRVLLSDQQVDLTRERQTVYSDIALRIQTPQGLAAGNVAFAWKPDTQSLTVHKLRIRRGEQVIDVLGSGQTFTVLRRETNLENATLDGVLTATMQPEGLQVGDVIEFAASITSSDPTVRGHVEQFSGAWNGIPIGRAHLSVRWPADLPTRIRRTDALPALKPVTKDGITAVDLLLDDVEPIAPPKNAPARYQMVRLVEFSDYSSWGEIGALMAPLYRKAAILPSAGPLQAEVARIKASSSDPKVRAEAALALVQDRIRYVALAMGAGGLVPADAEQTWSRRYGDCKGKTALLLGMLAALDIDSEPVVVSTSAGDGLNERLPMIGLFDHVLVRATIGGRAYWLDGTRTGDTALDRLTVPPFGWGLPLLAKGGALVRMLPAPLATPTQETSIRMDATGGLTAPAPTRIETTWRGDEAIGVRNWVAGSSGAARDAALRDYWRRQYDFIDVKSTSSFFDPKTSEQRLSMEGEARMDWSSGWYETNGTGVGYRADFARDPGPARDAPIAVPYPYYTKMSQTILLPRGFEPGKLVEDAAVDQTVAGIEYRRRATITGNMLTIEKTDRSVAPEFPFAQAATAQAALRALANRTLYLRAPASDRVTEKEAAVITATEPTTAKGFIDQGLTFLNRGENDAAIKAFDRASVLDPKSALALANRGMARIWQEDLVGAVRDLDAAAVIEPRNAVVFRARGVIAQANGDHCEAIAQYTRSLDVEPVDAFTLGHRAQVHRLTGGNDPALADSAAALKLSPDWQDLYLLRANIFRNQGKPDAAAAEAEAATAANPSESYAHVIAANIYHALDRDADAVRAYDRALAIKPEAFIYLNRGQRRPKTDLAGRRADIDSALKLDPTHGDVLDAKARMQVEAGDLASAVRTYTDALAHAPEDLWLRIERGLVHTRAGQIGSANRDFTEARAAATSVAALNNLCWKKGIAGLALASALEDCDAALAKSPDDSAALDSRAFVLLRLGRLDEAIAAYGRALAKRPRYASSLFGRAVAWSRKGDKGRSAADLDAARKIDVDVEKAFKEYGVAL